MMTNISNEAQDISGWSLVLDEDENQRFVFQELKLEPESVTYVTLGWAGCQQHYGFHWNVQVDPTKRQYILLNNPQNKTVRHHK